MSNEGWNLSDYLLCQTSQVKPWVKLTIWQLSLASPFANLVPWVSQIYANVIHQTTGPIYGNQMAVMYFYIIAYI